MLEWVSRFQMKGEAMRKKYMVINVMLMLVFCLILSGKTVHASTTYKTQHPVEYIEGYDYYVVINAMPRAGEILIISKTPYIGLLHDTTFDSNNGRWYGFRGMSKDYNDNDVPINFRSYKNGVFQNQIINGYSNYSQINVKIEAGSSNTGIGWNRDGVQFTDSYYGQYFGTGSITYSNFDIKEVASEVGNPTYGNVLKVANIDDSPNNYVRDTTIPTPSNLRVKMVLPSGLFPSVRETIVKATWTPLVGQYHTEISLLYDYKSGTDKITRLLPYIKYNDNINSSLGTHSSLMITDLEDYIHNANSSTVGQTFANGKLNLTHYYVRNSFYDSVSKKIKYSNWVKVDLVTGKSEIDKGNAVGQYDEVYEDEDGNEIKVPNSEYGGKYYDSDGNLVDPTSLTTFTDYLLAIPNILSSTFTALTSLISGMGSFGAVISAVFVGMPPIMTSM
ncbi:MAG: hypothetical protein K0Q49_2385 [Haloplasmataceae bacterium]|nr:hypothetical protein [Haloplasmataceae bacterium]